MGRRVRGPAGRGARLARVVDANANRAAEGLRAVEDLLRFARDDAALSGRARALRHACRTAAASLVGPGSGCRRSGADVGAGRWRSGRPRRGVGDILTANFRRCQESLRVLEECARVLRPGAAVRRLQNLRYAAYRLEERAERP